MGVAQKVSDMEEGTLEIGMGKPFDAGLIPYGALSGIAPDHKLFLAFSIVLLIGLPFEFGLRKKGRGFNSVLGCWLGTLKLTDLQFLI